MEPPKEFNEVCRRFHQDIAIGSDSIERLIQAALIGLDPNVQGVAKKYLRNLLASDPSSASLQSMWWQTPTSIFFAKDEDLLNFLKVLETILA